MSQAPQQPPTPRARRRAARSARNRLPLALLSLVACAAGATSSSPPPLASRPNILLLLADDLADWHLGCYGNREIRTPNIDRLAAEGTRMANAFVCTPICSPSRATLFTGRVPRQHGIHDFLTSKPVADPPQGWPAPPPSFKDEVMISDLLAESGYRCGYIGKWHMGDDATPQHRFEFWCAWTHGGRDAYNDPTMSLNGKPAREVGYATEAWTRRAVEFIRRRDAAERPWFLVVAYQNPHLPYEGHPQRYYDMYQGATFDTIGIEPKAPNVLREGEMMNDPVRNLRKAAAATTALDDQLPPLLAALDATGQRSRTLIVFTGDHGFLYGRHGAWSKGYATNPINMYEEVIRSPMIFSWPGGLAGGRVLQSFVSFYDMLPTLCEAAGVEPARVDALARSRDLCGKSYWPILLGRDSPWDNVVYCHFRNTEAVRTERHKLVLRDDGRGPNELFDLAADPREKANRIDDPACAGVRADLENRLRRWVRRYR